MSATSHTEVLKVNFNRTTIFHHSFHFSNIVRFMELLATTSFIFVLIRSKFVGCNHSCTWLIYFLLGYFSVNIFYYYTGPCESPALFSCYGPYLLRTKLSVNSLLVYLLLQSFTNIYKQKTNTHTRAAI